jgi:hypothetical protein
MEVRKMSKLPVPNVAALLLVALLLGCSVNVKKNEDKSDKNVDITTPIGGIHVSKNAEPHATGLDVYPGAKLIEKDHEGEDNSANVNISTPLFGLKVVAQEYQSDAPPEKLIDYYTGQLKKYGNVLQCRGSWKGGHVDMSHSKDKDKSKELKCNENSGDTVELKVGTKENQHLVSIAPNGKGSKFALVLMHFREKDESI